MPREAMQKKKNGQMRQGPKNAQFLGSKPGVGGPSGPLNLGLVYYINHVYVF